MNQTIHTDSGRFPSTTAPLRNHSRPRQLASFVLLLLSSILLSPATLSAGPPTPPRLEVEIVEDGSLQTERVRSVSFDFPSADTFVEATTDDGWLIFGRAPFRKKTITIEVTADPFDGGIEDSLLYRWWEASFEDNGSTQSVRTIRVIKFCDNSRGEPTQNEIRRWTVTAFPIKWKIGDYSPQTNVRTESITCEIVTFEVEAPDDGEGCGFSLDDPRRLQSIEDLAAPRGDLSRVDVVLVGPTVIAFTGIDTVKGGAIEWSPAPFGGKLPRYKFVNTLTLRVPVDNLLGQNAISEWLNDEIDESGSREGRTIEVTEILTDGSEGKHLQYMDCTVVGYRPPRLSASSAALLYVEIDVKPASVR